MKIKHILNEQLIKNTGTYSADLIPQVKKIQTLLQRLGYDVGTTGIDGKYGPRTEKAVRRFQQDNSLKVDGIVGPKTLAVLSASKSRSPRGNMPSIQNTNTNTRAVNQGIATTAKTSGSLSSMRQKFKQELQDAEFLDVVLALATAEVGPSNDSAQRAVLETLMNRAIAYNRSIRKEVYGGYYQPINQSATINKRLATIKANQQLRSKVLANLKAVLAGSNDSNVALHNASAGIAKTAHSLADVRAVIGGETFYNKTNPAGDKHYGGGYSGVRNKEQKFVNLVLQSLKNIQTGPQK
jgi:peptidoglycan hydrolase-like protein with peptidoglycan-binding domain